MHRVHTAVEQDDSRRRSRSERRADVLRIEREDSFLDRGVEDDRLHDAARKGAFNRGRGAVLPGCASRGNETERGGKCETRYEMRAIHSRFPMWRMNSAATRSTVPRLTSAARNENPSCRTPPSVVAATTRGASGPVGTARRYSTAGALARGPTHSESMFRLVIPAQIG